MNSGRFMQVLCLMLVSSKSQTYAIALGKWHVRQKRFVPRCTLSVVGEYRRLGGPKTAVIIHAVMMGLLYGLPRLRCHCVLLPGARLLPWLRRDQHRCHQIR